MNKQIVHYGTAVISVLTSLAAAVTAVVGVLPGGYKGVAVEVAAVLGAAILGVKAFDNAIAQQTTATSSDTVQS